MASEMTRRAAQLEISESYLNKIYHDRKRPGYNFVQAFNRLTGKKLSLEWWKTAKVKEIKEAIESI